MARLLALAESRWFELADELASAGETPTVKLLHALAKERFGVAASFTTIQRVLESWRRLGGAQRATELGPETLEIILKAFTPLYRQLRDQARGELEPRVMEAESQAEAADQRAKQLEAELAQLRDERQHLRSQLEGLAERERVQTAALASARTKADELQALHDVTTTRHAQQLTELQARINQQEERHAREREQLIEQHRAAVAEVTERFEAEIATLQMQSRVEIERRDSEFAVLREALQQAHTSQAALAAQKQAVEEQLGNALCREAELMRRVEKLSQELKSAQARLQRAEQAARDARAANVQMESAYQERIDQLQRQLETLAQGQAAIQEHFGKLVRQIAHGQLESITRSNE